MERLGAAQSSSGAYGCFGQDFRVGSKPSSWLDTASMGRNKILQPKFKGIE
jgi:hypothetical protein